jgi:hypothetical protein
VNRCCYVLLPAYWPPETPLDPEDPDEPAPDGALGAAPAELPALSAAEPAL